MSVAQSFRLALKNLLLSKMRSLLTMLGIIIGVAAVIIIISLGGGLSTYINEQFESMGSNLIMLSLPPRSTSRSVREETLFNLAEQNGDYIAAVSPFVSARAPVKYGSETHSSTVTGVAESYLFISKLTLTEGRFLQYLDVDRLQKVCVVGSYVAEEILNHNAIGNTISIGGYSYKVVGTLKEKAGGYKGSDDDVIFIPYTNACRLNGSSYISTYYFSAVSDQTVTHAQWLVENKLKTILGDEDQYFIMNMAQIMSMMGTVQGMVMTILVAIAAISLVVGGIGIMNIMLVTVTERTREIGIRKSLGAKQKDIRSQFLIEAGSTSAIGGIIGIIIGGGLAGAVGSLLGISAPPSVTSVVVAFSVSVGIGVIFGYLPANKAARLHPIDALRHE